MTIDTSLDHSDLRRVILSEGDQISEGFAIAKNISGNAYDHIMISGMGGSALPGNVLRTYVNSLFDVDRTYKKIGIYANRFYKLPPEAYENCLNLICSHSGNTEETVSAFHEAVKNHLPCIGISSGGKIEELCKEYDVPHVKLPIPFENFQPRMATGHFVSVIVQILVNHHMIPDCTKDLRAAAKTLDEQVPMLEDHGKELAQRLHGKTPVIYGSTHFKALAMIWKIKFNENAKTPAFWNFFPELNHNEFVGFTNPQAPFHIVMLRDTHDDPRNLKRYDVTKDFLEKNNISAEIIDMPEGTLFERLFLTLALGDWASYYLALSYGQDPTPVDWVEEFKKLL